VVVRLLGRRGACVGGWVVIVEGSIASEEFRGGFSSYSRVGSQSARGDRLFQWAACTYKDVGGRLGVLEDHQLAKVCVRVCCDVRVCVD
jgi:hypothetical protein